jgi:hypothetical protein
MNNNEILIYAKRNLGTNCMLHLSTIIFKKSIRVYKINSMIYELQMKQKNII